MYAQRMFVYNNQTGTIMADVGAMKGTIKPDIRPALEHVSVIYVDDEFTPAIRVNPDTLEVEWEPVDNTPVIEDVAASLIQ